MLDEYHAAVGGKLHEAAAAMIVGFYAEWKAAHAAPLPYEDDEPVRYCQGCFGAGTGARCCICNGFRDSGVATGSLAGEGYGPFGGAS